MLWFDRQSRNSSNYRFFYKGNSNSESCKIAKLKSFDSFNSAHLLSALTMVLNTFLFPNFFLADYDISFSKLYFAAFKPFGLFSYQAVIDFAPKFRLLFSFKSSKFEAIIDFYRANLNECFLCVYFLGQSCILWYYKSLLAK